MFDSRAAFTESKQCIRSCQEISYPRTHTPVGTLVQIVFSLEDYRARSWSVKMVCNYTQLVHSSLVLQLSFY